MNIGIRAALLGVLCIGAGNTAMKYIANRYTNNYTGLLLQYVAMALSALLCVVVISRMTGTAIFPVLDLQSWGVLTIVGIVGYIGIVCLFKAFTKLCSGVALIVANLSVFLSYFANLHFFDASESLPWLQVVLAVLFFVVVSQFLRTKSTCPADQKSNAINRNILYSVGTALCWTVFFVGNTWFVKNHIMTPVQSVFATESIILVVAFVHYLIAFRADFSDVIASFSKKDLIPLATVGICNVGGNFLFYYGYLDNPANIINFIRLFSIIATAVFAWFVLKDYMTKKQMVLMMVAFFVLIAFIFAENILD